MTPILNKIRAGYPGLYLVSHEETRCESMLLKVASTLNFGLHAWSIGVGRLDTSTGQIYEGEGDPYTVLDAVERLPEQSLLLLRDFHLHLSDPDPVLYRKLKNALLHAKSANKTLIFLGAVLKLPLELEKLVSVVEFGMPDRTELRAVLDGLAESFGKPLPPDVDPLLDALSGLTSHEAEDALSLAVIETGTWSPVVVAREKAQCVKKNGLLELVESRVNLDSIGGLEVLKEDLGEKRHLFTKAARDYGLSSPRGYLVVGQPGTGKSLTAQATGNIFGIPLLKVEGGNIFGSLVGESERNLRTIMATAKAVAPCVLWIDEADGLFSGAAGGGSGGGKSGDGGTTNRVIKGILQAMQFESEGIFWMFTANDIDGFPDPLIDRLDVWSVDLPNAQEREAIWTIQIQKRDREPALFDVPALAQWTEGFSGRQIEQLWLKAMTRAFNDGHREPSTEDVIALRPSFIATSVTMSDAIESRRKRLAGRTTPASRPMVSAPAPQKSRKLAA